MDNLETLATLGTRQRIAAYPLQAPGFTPGLWWGICGSHLFSFLCFFVLYLMLPVSLDCPFLIAPLVFSGLSILEIDTHISL
jgi:hypothetical protein